MCHERTGSLKRHWNFWFSVLLIYSYIIIFMQKHSSVKKGLAVGYVRGWGSGKRKWKQWLNFLFFFTPLSIHVTCLLSCIGFSSGNKSDLRGNNFHFLSQKVLFFSNSWPFKQTLSMQSYPLPWLILLFLWIPTAHFLDKDGNYLLLHQSLRKLVW